MNFNSNLIPDVDGRDLGTDSQRWNLKARLIDIASGLNGGGFQSFRFAQTVLTAGGVIVPRSGSIILDSATELALTLETPVPGDEDGFVLSILSVTAAPHTVTLLSTGALSVSRFNGSTQTVATFAAAVGSQITLEAYNGFWYVRYSSGVALS